MKKKKHPNAGSTLEDFLKEDGNYEAATLIAVKRVIAWQLEKAMAERDLSKTEMAALMETSRRQLSRVLNPEDGNVTLDTLQRAAKAVGRTLRLELA
ncbi:MAG: helix-turn-helix transcriptional regulator [Alphaproteobacteria bacterium]|nr:helix-turn-helix transcriptional regulator [Alphaproteobacteria bacterium]